MLISRVLPIMSVYRLPHGQYGYRGHILNVPQDVTSFANTLPRSPAELDVMIVRREGSANSHKDFRVRRSVIINSLRWLVNNNIYYRNVTIDENLIALLPIDSDLTTIPCITVPATLEEEIPAHSPHEDSDTAHMSSTFVPLPATGITERQAIYNSLLVNMSTAGLQLLDIQSMSLQLMATCPVHFQLFSRQVLQIVWPQDNRLLPLEITSNT